MLSESWSRFEPATVETTASCALVGAQSTRPRRRLLPGREGSRSLALEGRKRELWPSETHRGAAPDAIKALRRT